jgi:hypothetical protein
LKRKSSQCDSSFCEYLPLEFELDDYLLSVLKYWLDLEEYFVVARPSLSAIATANLASQACYVNLGSCVRPVRPSRTFHGLSLRIREPLPAPSVEPSCDSPYADAKASRFS